MRYFIETLDERNIILKKLMQDDGYDVAEFDLTKIGGGDALVFSPAKKWKAEFAESLPDGAVVYAGKMSADAADVLRAKKIEYRNYMANETFVVKNANLTAEGVLALIIEHTAKSIYECKILILGGGRLGKSIATVLSKLNLEFALCEYDESKRGDLFVFTDDVIRGGDFIPRLNEFDVIVNTIPAPVITEKTAESVPISAVLIETASVSCLAKSDVKFKCVSAPRLPQRYCAESASRLMMEFIKGKY